MALLYGKILDVCKSLTEKVLTSYKHEGMIDRYWVVIYASDSR